MTYVLNPGVKVTPGFGDTGLQWTVAAPVRGEGLRQSLVTAASMPAAHAFLMRVATSADVHVRVDPAAAAELASIGFLVLPAGAPAVVTFSVPVGAVRPPATRLGAIAVNRRVRIGEVPADDLFAPGRMALVTDPVRGIELPYWLDGEQERVVTRLLSTGDVPRRLERRMRQALIAVGILHDPDVTRVARRRFNRRMAAARARIDSPGYVVFGELLPSPFIGAVRRYIRAIIREGHLPLGDGQVEGRYAMHNERLCAWLHERLTPLIARAVPRPIKRSYAFAAAYVGGAVLGRHTDRRQCEYTLSLTVDATPSFSRDAAWPLCLASKAERAVVKVLLAPGDALLFRGRTVPHFREPLPAERTSTSLLFHFVSRGFRGPLS
jgi:hypothetical protein